MRGKRGAWINQYSRPSAETFKRRARQIDYVIIKYGLAEYEVLARQVGIPWLAEIYAYETDPIGYGRRLGEQANQVGCIGAVINLEYSDGSHWDQDNGDATNALITEFQRVTQNKKPLYASLDTRGTRPNDPYQVVCSNRCTGVMPMVYPQAFSQTPERAFNSALNGRVFDRWTGKEIIPTFQAYGPISPADVSAQAAICTALLDTKRIAGANFYTLGHATEEQWNRCLEFLPWPATPAPSEDVAAALKALRAAWIAQWHQVEQHGTVQEAASLAEYWTRLTGQK